VVSSRNCLRCNDGISPPCVGQTYPLFNGRKLCHSAHSDASENAPAKQDGKEHRYFSVVENRRLRTGKIAQRRVLYLGEINDSQQAAWRKTLEVFVESEQRFTELSLFPEDREIPSDAVNSIQIKLDQMELHRPRAWGNAGWAASSGASCAGRVLECAAALPAEAVPWELVLQLLVVNRLIDPGSEFRLHRQWFDQSAMAELLGVDFAAAGGPAVPCLDRLGSTQQELFAYLRQRCRTCRGAVRHSALDLTSTYFEAKPRDAEGQADTAGIPPDVCRWCWRWLSRRRDFSGLEVMEATRRTASTLRGFLEKVEKIHAKARACG